MSETAASPLPGTVLVVDDDDFTRRLLKLAVESVDNQVLLASSVEEAFVLLARHPVDVVLLDMVMPGSLDGLTALSQMRAAYPRLEVIMCTSVNSVESAVTALRGGASDYLVKPIVPVVLQRAVARALDTRRLLGENERLRRALDQLTAGQRLQAAQDTLALGNALMESLAFLTGATSVAVVVEDAILASRNLPADLVDVLPRFLHTNIPSSTSAALCPGQEPLPLGVGPVVQLWVPPARLAAVAWRAPAAPPFTAQDAEAASFLAQTAAQSLHNLSRFAAATEAARRDSLTGLLNARVLEEVVSQGISRATQEAYRFALVFLDLDHFKNVNDAHGHLAGSKVLVELAAVLQRTVRPMDLVFRYGGDEFAVVLVGASRKDALRVCERIRLSIERHPFLAREGTRVSITASLGVASHPDGGAKDAAALLKASDEAMYRSKQGGKNRVSYLGQDAPE